MPKDTTGNSPQNNPRLHQAVFPLKVKSTRPLAVSADSKLIAKGEDHFDYVVKDTISGTVPLLPHTEWFCSELGRAINIPSPEPRILEMAKGSFAFGSTWQEGPVNPAIGGWWYERVANGEIDFGEISIMLSRIRAFDEFIYNPDRHEENLLFPKLEGGYACVGMDYSRAWIINGFPLPAVPLPPFCNTTRRLPAKLYAAWKKEYIRDDVVVQTIAAIKAIHTARIKRILDGHPKEWLPQTMRSAILKWWGSPEMHARADAIPAGVKNGLRF